MKEYTIDIGGVEHTVQLTDEDAKRLNAQPVSTKDAPAPANKARKAAATKKG